MAAGLLFGVSAALFLEGCLKGKGGLLIAAGLFTLAGCVLIK